MKAHFLRMPPMHLDPRKKGDTSRFRWTRGIEPKEGDKLGIWFSLTRYGHYGIYCDRPGKTRSRLLQDDGNIKRFTRKNRAKKSLSKILEHYYGVESQNLH